MAAVALPVQQERHENLHYPSRIWNESGGLRHRESHDESYDMYDNDFDNDHSFGQLPVHKALTCSEGQSAWSVAPPRLAKEIRSMHLSLIKVLRSDLLPLEIKRSCICAGKEMCCTQNVCHDKPWLLFFFFLKECA